MSQVAHWPPDMKIWQPFQNFGGQLKISGRLKNELPTKRFLYFYTAVTRFKCQISNQTNPKQMKMFQLTHGNKWRVSRVWSINALQHTHHFQSTKLGLVDIQGYGMGVQDIQLQSEIKVASFHFANFASRYFLANNLHFIVKHWWQKFT